MPNRGPKTAAFAGRSLRRSLVPCLVLFAVGCGDNEITRPPPPPPPPPAPVASVTVSPDTPSIFAGTAVQLSATTKDAQGNTLSGRAITWSSNAEATATVSDTGVVTGVSVGGPVTITATSEGQAGTAQVTVTTPPFILTLSSSTLSTAQGASTPTTTVNLVRDNFTGPVSLSAHGDNDSYHGGMPRGVTAAFSPNPATGDRSVLTLSADATTVPNVYVVWVHGEASTGSFEVRLTLTVTAASP